MIYLQKLRNGKIIKIKLVANPRLVCTQSDGDTCIAPKAIQTGTVNP
jgi:hypothetical protein